MSADVSTPSVASSYHAKRQRAKSFPNGYKSSTSTSAIENHFEHARTQNVSIQNTPNNTDDFNDNQPRSVTQAPEQVQAAPVPHWQRELAKSRVGRHSRASSIISTRTRLTVQSDDARSVDIEAGGQSFHINRDGSMVTNVTAPPPYPGPPLHKLPEESDEDDSLRRLSSSETVREEPQTPELQVSRSLQSLPIRTHLPSTTSDDEPSTTTTPALSRKTSAFELPKPFRSVLNLSWYRSPPPAETLTTPATTQPTKPLRRTKSDSSSLANFRLFEPTIPNSNGLNGTQNGDISTSNSNNTSDSDDDDTSSSTHNKPHHRHKHPERRHRRHHPKHHHNSPLPPLPPPQDLIDSQTAELSSHYTRLLRTIDRSHRAALHERDLELARLRELLNEKDIIYRQQLRDRDQVISELNERVGRGERRLEAVEEGVESRVEKARNQVEDMWEGRWKEYERCLRERLGGSGSWGGSERGRRGPSRMVENGDGVGDESWSEGMLNHDHQREDVSPFANGTESITTAQ